jgi:metal-dependent amidase/aminoacylase/carboxypeptidase family protein
MQTDIRERVKRTATDIAASAGATAEVTVVPLYPSTVNDPALTARMTLALTRAAGGKVATADKVTSSEDFSFYGRKAPALFAFLGVTPAEQMASPPSYHSPKFVVDEAALVTGVRALTGMTIEYLQGAPAP